MLEVPFPDLPDTSKLNTMAFSQWDFPTSGEAVSTVSKDGP